MMYLVIVYRFGSMSLSCRCTYTLFIDRGEAEEYLSECMSGLTPETGSGAILDLEIYDNNNMKSS